MLDRAAERKPNIDPKDTATAIVASLSAVLSAVDLANGTLTKILPDSPVYAWLPSLILIALLVLCVHMIGATDEVPAPAGIGAAKPKIRRFRYANAVRHVAKAAALVLLITIPVQLYGAARMSIPLPATISGLVLQERDRTKGVADAMVSVVEHDGTDITRGRWLTDSDGFYSVSATRRIPRTATLHITRPDCKPATLSLAPAFQVKDPKRATPMFRHTMDCGAAQ